MLLIPVRIAPSKIHGLGVFCLSHVPKGTKVWKFSPGFDLDLDIKTLDDQPPHVRHFLLHYGYIDHRVNRLIMGCDDYRFINNNGIPNLYTEYADDHYGIDIAAIDIDIGAELTLDYGVFEELRLKVT